MKESIKNFFATFISVVICDYAACATSWAGPPPPPTIPATPVGNAEISAATIAAVALYGYWKNRK